jgi:iron-sulfur cluster assembly protein
MSVHLSPAAIAEVNRIKAKYSGSTPYFRLGVQSGGCADLHYTLALDESIAASDRVLDCQGIQVVIDTKSWQYLNGLKLDYTEDLMGGGFRFDNPNAVSSCGCGNSFSTEDQSVSAV